MRSCGRMEALDGALPQNPRTDLFFLEGKRADSPYQSVYLRENPDFRNGSRGSSLSDLSRIASSIDRMLSQEPREQGHSYKLTFTPPGKAVKAVSMAVVAPFLNDGPPPVSKGAAGSLKEMRDLMRVSSPRLVLPSINDDSTGLSSGTNQKVKRNKPKHKAVAVPNTESGRHSAPPGDYSAEYIPSSEMGCGYLPMDLWNNVVARNVDMDPEPHFGSQHFGRNFSSFDAMVRPFQRLKMRQYMKSTWRPMVDKVSKESRISPERSRPEISPLAESTVRRKQPCGSIFEEGREAASQALRPEAPPSRLEASLLKEALDTMTNNIKNENGEEPRRLARQAAVRGNFEQVSTNMEPELYVLDIVLSELVKQENASCKERGGVLEAIRLRLLDLFSTATLAVNHACSDMDHITEENTNISQYIEPLKEENAELHRKIDELESDKKSMKFKISELTETIEKLSRSNEETQYEEHQGATVREQQAHKLMKEANEMRDMLQSKVTILNAQLRQQDANMDVLRMQIQQLEDRVRRDVENIEFLGLVVAQYKVRLAWTRVMAWARRTKKPTAEAETQDGQGLPDAEGIGRRPSVNNHTYRSAHAPSEYGSIKDARKQVVTKESLQGVVIAYSSFWAGVVQQASRMDFTLHPHLQMTRKELLDLIATTYSEKILADEIDERSKLNKQSLPEFLYDHYLEIFGEPQLAEEALVIIVANVRTYDSVSARAWMFSRFLSVGGQPLPTEALSIYLASLVRIQNGQLPLLPGYDGITVDAARAMRAIEYVFNQVPFVVRAKVLQECEKLSTGINVDLDSLLLCIIEQWKEESGRAEERLRALFVASDIDGDGNLDIKEFTSIINNLRGNKGHREMLRMYSEMTLNKIVDCNTFVRVCRKCHVVKGDLSKFLQFRFFTFEVGPLTKKQDLAAKEVFDQISEEWSKCDRAAMELIAITAGTPGANRLEQLSIILRKKLHERYDPEETWHIFRIIIDEMTSMVRNHVVEPPPYFMGMAMKTAVSKPVNPNT